MKVSLVHQLIACVAIVLASELAFILMLCSSINSAEQQYKIENHFREVANHSARVLSLMQELSVSFMKKIAKKKSKYDLPELTDRLKAEFSELHDQLKDSPEDQAFVNEMRTALEDAMALIYERTMRYPKEPSPERFIYTSQLSQRAKKTMSMAQTLRDKYRDMNREEERKSIAARAQLNQLVLFGGGAQVLLAALVMFAFAFTTTSRVRRIIANGERLGRLQRLPAPLTGDDELAQLDVSLHLVSDALIASHQRQIAITEHASDAIFSLDEEMTLRSANTECTRVLGHSQDELTGKRFIDYVTEDERERTAVNLREVVETNSPIRFETEFNTVAPMKILLSASWSSEEDTLTCIAHDITKRKEAESALKESTNRLTTMFEHLPLALLEIDSKGKVERANRRAEELFQRQKNEFDTASLADLFAGLHNTASSAADWLSQMAESGKVVELAVRTAAQTSCDNCDMELAGTLSRPRRQTYGELTLTALPHFSHQLVCVKDVTTHREIEILKEQFVAMVSHDLRTPLASIDGSLDLILAGSYGQVSTKGIARIKQAQANIHTLTKLVNDLLDIEKLEAGDFLMEKNNISLSSVAETAISSVRAFADEQKIEIVAEFNDVTVIGDFDRLVRVVTNLLSNALKFSPSGSAVQVIVRPTNKGAELKVIDKGKGIPDAFKSSVFERFKQAPGAQHARIKGSGLGLSICKAIVEAHAGSISVESDEGHGSTFLFVLPLAGDQIKNPEKSHG